jgi:tetratricopeptide (TPR) repeat protein
MSIRILPRSARFTLLALLAALPACQKDSGPAGKIPVTTSNEEARALFMKGREMSDQLKTTEAHDLFAQAVDKDPTFALANLNQAQNANTNSEFFDHLKAAVAQADKVSDGERYLILGAQAGADGDRPKALAYAESLTTRYPDDERAHMVLGNAYQARQDYAKAVEQFQKATTIAATFAPAYNSLGYALRPLGKNDEAEVAFKKYIDLVPNDPNPYDSYAELLLKMGRFDESIPQYEKALAIDPAFFNSRLGIAWNMTLQGKFDAALAEADKALATARNENEKRTSIFTRTATLLVADKSELAIAEVQKGTAISAAAGDTSAMAADAGVIGDILLESGKADDAMKSYQRQVDLINASSLSATVKDNAGRGHRFDRARVAVRKGDLETARSLAAEYLADATARSNDGQVRSAHLLMGLIALAEKNADGALTHLASADQQDPYVLYQTGLALTAKGDKAKAKEAFAAAANMNILPTVNYALVLARARKAAM